MPKKPKLTPEERKALRLEKKAEKKLRKIEQKKQLKRDHLDREIKYGALTHKRHEKEWRSMLIKITLPRMRQELQYAWHNFERIIDCKDFTISLLMDEVQNAEEQYMANFRSHVESLDNFFEMFHNQLEELKKDNQKEIENLGNRNQDEIDDIQNRSGDGLEYLKTMMYRLEIEKKEQERTQKADYFSKLDEEEVQCQLGIQKMKGKLEDIYQGTYTDMKGFIKSFNNRIKDRKKEFNQLEIQDNQMQDLIMQQLKRINKFYDILGILRNKYADMKQTEGQKLTDLEAERGFFHDSFKQLKEKLEHDRKGDAHKLMILCDCCKSTVNRLESIKTKGENILKLAIVCRKLETQREKILAFPEFQLARIPSELFRRDTDAYMQPKMDFFWQKVGKAGSLKYAIEEEQNVLKNQNLFYAKKFREYCLATTVPKPNFRIRAGKANIVEGTEVMKNVTKQMMAKK